MPDCVSVPRFEEDGPATQARYEGQVQPLASDKQKACEPPKESTSLMEPDTYGKFSRKALLVFFDRKAHEP